jgi:hypothetical protein
LHQGKYLLGQDTNQHQGRKGLFHP